MVLVTIAFAVVASFAAPASAHTRSESHSDWRISANHVEATIAVPTTTLKMLGPPERWEQPGQLAGYLNDKVAVTADGAVCAHPPARVLMATPQYQRVQFEFDCPSGRTLKLGFHGFFELAPSHTGFAQVQTGAGAFVEQLFTDDHQVIDLSSQGQSPLKNASFFKYVQLGMMHIFTGVDHMSFLVGLVLISRRLKDLLFVVTGFTIGHSCTLALAVTGILRPHAEYIDALVALTIAMVGAENIAVATGKPGIVAAGLGGLLLLMVVGRLLGLGGLPILLLLGAGLFSANYLMMSGHLRDAARLRILVTLVFGLIHGFGFAAGLLEMQLPKERLAELLVGFNLGVEIGQVTLVVTCVGVAALLVKFRMALPRTLVVDVGSAALVGIGLYWFLGRAYA